MKSNRNIKNNSGLSPSSLLSLTKMPLLSKTACSKIVDPTKSHKLLEEARITRERNQQKLSP